MAAAAQLTFPALMASLKKGDVAPVYLIHGEEGFYADKIVKVFEQMLPESERDFNLYILYASQTSALSVVDACQRYPMMAERQIVILKEAQTASASDLSGLVPYVGNPSPTTVLVIVARGALIKSAELVKKIREGGGVIFESKKLYERSIRAAISDFVKEHNLSIEDRSAQLLQDYIGADLSRLYNEIAKLAVVLGKGAMITPESIERNIGISKDYNTFELQDALATRNFAKSMAIVEYFRRNPKNNPVQPVLSVLFNYFSNILVSFYSPDKTDAALQKLLGFRTSFQVRAIRAGMSAYNAWQVIEILSAIRRCDAASKGVDSRRDPYDLLQELIFRILTTDGHRKV